MKCKGCKLAICVSCQNEVSNHGNNRVAKLNATVNASMKIDFDQQVATRWETIWQRADQHMTNLQSLLQQIVNLQAANQQ